MIYALLSVLAMACLRRLDGVGKDRWRTYIIFNRYELKLSDVSAFVTRVAPVFIFAQMVAVSFGNDWDVLFWALMCGVAVSASLQMSYEDWTKFNIAQLAHYWVAIFAYAILWQYDPALSAYGALCCILAGLCRPLLNKLSVRNYTAVCEYLEGGLLISPFVFINI